MTTGTSAGSFHNEKKKIAEICTGMLPKKFF
jgi:hypothetical protein